MQKFFYKLENFKNSLEFLERNICTKEKNTVSDLNSAINDGIIWRFGNTHNCCWKALREYFLSEGLENVCTPKSAYATAFQLNLISDEQGWLGILNDRKGTTYPYEDEYAEAVCERIKNTYIILFRELYNVLEAKGQEANE